MIPAADNLLVMPQRTTTNLIMNGSFENFTAPDQPLDWTVVGYQTIPNSINQAEELGVAMFPWAYTTRDGGRFCAVTTKGQTGDCLLYQGFTGMQPGQWYYLEVWVGGQITGFTTAVDQGIQIRLRNNTLARELDTSGVWGAYTQNYCWLETLFTNLGIYRKARWTRTPDDFSSTDQMYLYLARYGSTASDSQLYVKYDGVRLVGPFATPLAFGSFAVHSSGDGRRGAL